MDILLKNNILSFTEMDETVGDSSRFESRSMSNDAASTDRKEKDIKRNESQADSDADVAEKVEVHK